MLVAHMYVKKDILGHVWKCVSVIGYEKDNACIMTKYFQPKIT